MDHAKAIVKFQVTKSEKNSPLASAVGVGEKERIHIQRTRLHGLPPLITAGKVTGLSLPLRTIIKEGQGSLACILLVYVCEI